MTRVLFWLDIAFWFACLIAGVCVMAQASLDGMLLIRSGALGGFLYLSSAYIESAKKCLKELKNRRHD